MSNYCYFYPMDVRYGDLDPQGHLNNAKYLTYFEQARIKYFVDLGLFQPGQSFLDIGVIMAEALITFHAPVKYGAKVNVGVYVSKLGKKSITVEQKILDAQSGEMLASGRVILVAFDYHKNKSILIPNEMREAIANYEGLKTE